MMRWIGKFALISLVGLASLAALAQAQLEGRYEPIGKIPELHSLSVVHVEEFLNFTCPHCNNFRQAAKPLHDKYGKRVDWVNVPVLFPGQSDYALRLFYVGQRAGAEEQIKNLIFDATFKYGVNINDPAVVNYLAKSAGLGELYQKEGQADWVTEKVQAGQQRAMDAGVRATPTIVVQSALRTTPETGMQVFIANVDRLIGQLLKK